MDDFSTILPLGIFDESGLFLEEPLQDDAWNSAIASASSSIAPSANPTPPPAAAAAAPSPTFPDAFEDFDDDDDEEEEDSKHTKKKPTKSTKKKASTAASEEDGGDDEDKAKKRRQQIAAASRASRARRKRELDDLRDENKRLREERSQFLTKIGTLQMKVEHMRERGSTDMRVENELLRAQLEEHKRFVSCFKRLCDGAPSSLKAKHEIYKQGSDNTQAHVLGLISQSQHDAWLEATIPHDADIPFSNFSMFYKFKQEYGTEDTARRRLNVRVDATFPGMDANEVAEFFWNSFSDTHTHEKLLKVKGVEVSQLADDSPDKDTKTVYYREKWEAPRKDQDWVALCNRKKRELGASALALPHHKGPTAAADGEKVSASILAMSTTQHGSSSSIADGAERITSLFIQGCVVWNHASDARLCCVFSLPDDVKLKAVERLEDVVDERGVLSSKFGEVLRSFREMMGESGGVDLI